MNPVAYFEIPVASMPRAQRFYERVFGTELELAEIDGNQMALFPFTEGHPGASGALACGPSYVPGKSGVRIYFSVEHIDHTLALALREGADANYPVTEVPGYGWVAEFIDPEGNCIALYAAARTQSEA
jgi:predicted enzyme related to lactoylglutathione lyase